MGEMVEREDPRDMVVNGFILTSVGIVQQQAGEVVSFDNWRATMQWVDRARTAAMWWYGDLLNYGHAQYGDDAFQEEGGCPFSEKTIYDAKYVASQVDVSIRIENLTWNHHKLVAPYAHRLQKKWLRLADENKWSLSKFREHLRDGAADDLLEENPLPDGQYRCIVIDPPWPVEKIEREERPLQGLDIKYPVMSLEKIASLPVDSLGDDECHLYLWTTQRFLPNALEMVDGWGFKYQCLLTWVKPTGMTPFSWMYNTEHVVYATRGGLALATQGLKLSFEAPVLAHSAKPDVFYERAALASPEPRLNMFQRKERDGFSGWGNESV